MSGNSYLTKLRNDLSSTGPRKSELGTRGMSQLNMKVNGVPVSGQAEGRTLLVQFLRDRLGLTGTHIGCDTSQCGACVVHVNGDAVKAALIIL